MKRFCQCEARLLERLGEDGKMLYSIVGNEFVTNYEKPNAYICESELEF